MALPNIRRQATALVGATLALSASATVLAIDEAWILDDLAKAKQQAAEQNKDLMIDFTGSDWCVWCTRLDEEVFAQSQFKEEAPKDFVLVALDFPNAKPQTDEVKKANEAARAKYGVSGFPTVILANAKGEAYARTGYRPNGAGPYLEHLELLMAGRDKRDELMAEAKEAGGLERARLLDEALNIQDIVVPNRIEVMEQIVALDSENEAGLKERYEQQLVDARVTKAIGDAQAKLGTEDFAGAEAILAGVDASKATGPIRGQLAMMQLQILFTQEKYDEMSAFVKERISDEGIPVEARMQMSLARIEAAVAKKDMAMVERILDETVAIGPESQMATMINMQREQIIASIKAQMETVPHDHDGDGVPDHAPGEHGG